MEASRTGPNRAEPGRKPTGFLAGSAGEYREQNVWFAKVKVYVLDFHEPLADMCHTSAVPNSPRVPSRSPHRISLRFRKAQIFCRVHLFRSLSRIGTDSFMHVIFRSAQSMSNRPSLFRNFPALKVCAEAGLSVSVCLAKVPIDFEARWIAIAVWIEEIGFQFSGLDSHETFRGIFPIHS